MKYAEQLAALLGGQRAQPMPQQSPQLGGMVGGAQQALGGRAYQLHQQEAQAMGQQPMTPEQWMASQAGR